ncbi:MAG: tetratricopeptide repeat protein [Deltaproteobacteria bacterium]|nr:tetratricopeptide repeat protein [Deltaproteobacteria bacterium]
MKRLIVCVGLAIAIGGAYYNALGNGFVFDDYLLVVDKPAIRTSSSIWTVLSNPLSLGYRPLRTLTYLFDYRIGGMQPWIFHLNNVLYHWITACLVLVVALRLTNAPTVEEEQWRWRPAVLIAFLWALHPVQTDTVTYIAGRRDILGGLCLFAGLWAYLRFRRSASPGRGRYGWLLLSCLSYGLGILSKESVIVLPLLCWVYDMQQEGLKESLRRRWALYLTVLLLGAMVLWYFAGWMILRTIQQSAWHGGSMAGNFATVARIWVHYLSVMIYPHTLLADYSYDAFPVSRALTEPDVLWALMTLGVAALGVWGLARWRSLCGYGGAWMLIAILPISHIVPIQEIAAEHYLYVPLFGLCLMGGLLLDALCGVSAGQPQAVGVFRPVVGMVLVVTLLGGAVARIVTRNRDWLNEERLWSETLATAPRSVRAHYNLAGVYKQQKRVEDAAREFMATLALAPKHVGALVGFGELAFEAGQYGQALYYGLQAQRVAPRNPRAIYLLAWVRLALKEVTVAETLFQQARTLMPNTPGVYAGLLAVAKERGDSKAEAQWAEKLRVMESSPR